MPEQPSARPFPLWLIALDLVAALLIVAGLLLRNSPAAFAALALPRGTDVLLLGLGALGVVACGAQFGRIALTAARSKSSP